MHSKRIEYKVRIEGIEIILICVYYPATKSVDILGWKPAEDEEDELSYQKGVALDRIIKRQRRQLELKVIDYATEK